MSKAGKISRTGDLKTVKNILGNYRLEKTIGEGTFGKVKYGIHLPTEERVAVKILEKEKIQDKEDLDRITREIHFLKKLKHQNIIKIYEIVENSKNFYIIMEYAFGGELFNYIVKKKRLDEKETSNFFYQLVTALDYIHKNNIVHRDLKPENLLLTENNIIKVIDFGLSNQYKNGQLLNTPCGSPCYAAPEMILGRKYSGLMVDIWSMGIILYAMICGYLPFEDKNNDRLYKKILECKIEFPDHVTTECKDLIKKILTINPTKRIKLEELKNHPFLKNGEIIFKKEESNLFQDKSKLSEIVIEKMIDLGFDKSDITFNIENNKHNNITTTYDLLLNKLKNSPTLVSSSSEKSSNDNKIEANQNINININYMNKIGNINININEKKKEDTECDSGSKNKKEDTINQITCQDNPKKLKIVKNYSNRKSQRYSNRTVNTIDVFNTSPEKTNFKQLNNKNKAHNYIKGNSISHNTNISNYSQSNRESMSVNNLKDNDNNSLTLDLPTFIQNNKLDSNNIIIATSMISPLNKLNKYGKKNNINITNASNLLYKGRTMAFSNHDRKINTSVSVDKNAEFSTTLRTPFSESGQNFGSSIASKLVPNNTIDLTSDTQKMNTSIHSHKVSYVSTNENNPIKRSYSTSEDNRNKNDNRNTSKAKIPSQKMNENNEKNDSKKNSTRSQNVQSSNSTQLNYSHNDKNKYMQNIISDFRKRIKNLSIGEKPETPSSNLSKFGSTMLKSSDSQSCYDNYSQSKYTENPKMNSNQTINMQTLSNKEQSSPKANKSGSSTSISKIFPNSTKNKNQMAFQSFKNEKKQESSINSNRNLNSSINRNHDVSKISRVIDLTTNVLNTETNSQRGKSPNSSYQQKFKQKVVGFGNPTVPPITTVTLLTQSSTNSSNTNMNNTSINSMNTTNKKKTSITINNKQTSVKKQSVDKKSNQVKSNISSTGYCNNLTNMTPNSLKYDKYLKTNTIKTNNPTQSSSNSSLKQNEPNKEKDLLHNLNKTKSQNADFACCTLSGSNAVNLNLKLQDHCKANNLILREFNTNNFECSKDNNVISLEITKLGANNVMKLQHICGSDLITKEMIKNIIINIGF